ncbi:MAG TPA: MBL fold metallo-hydrolase [Pantanalinema sp.]
MQTSRTPTVTLRLFAAGSCVHPEGVVVKGAPMRPCTLPALVALIAHPEHGAILFDTGYSDRFHQETASYPNRLYAKLTPVSFSPEESAATQLAARGVAPEQVKTVVLSHFHADHVGAVRDFPEARYLYSSESYAAMRPLTGLGAVRAGFLRGLLPDDFEARSSHFEDLPACDLGATYAPFNRGADLCGDQSVVAVPLPGHAEGHHGLMLRTEEGPVFLVADAVYKTRAFKENRPPMGIARLIFSDWKGYLDTMSRLHAFHQARPDVLILPSHCQEAWEAFEARGKN